MLVSAVVFREYIHLDYHWQTSGLTTSHAPYFAFILPASSPFLSLSLYHFLFSSLFFIPFHQRSVFEAKGHGGYLLGLLLLCISCHFPVSSILVLIAYS